MEWLPLGTVVGLFSVAISIMWRRQNRFRDNELNHIQKDISDVFKYITANKDSITDVKVAIATIQGDIKRLDALNKAKPGG